MKRLYILFFVVIAGTCCYAQQTYVFVERDSTLHLDVYQPQAANGYTIVHVFGGGFIDGARNKKWDSDYCRMLAESGYTVVAIDYRLGLKGVKKVGLSSIDVLENAMMMAVEDCSAAVAYIVSNAAALNIDPDKIILEGVSAGAITVLMTDYARCNHLPATAVLPDNWKPAGVVSYSGAIFSRQGKVKWGDTNNQADSAIRPAPTMLFHGTVDKIVPYKQIVFGKLGMFGSDALAKRYDKFNMPYRIFRYTDLGHEVSIGGPKTIDELNLFVQQYITEGRKLHSDITVRDDDIQPSDFTYFTRKDLYNPKKKK